MGWTDGPMSERERAEDAHRISGEFAHRSIKQLEVILQNVADGITLQDRRGRLVYANQAAAMLCGYSSVEALLAAPPGAVVQQFDLFDEMGQPFTPDKLPGRLALAGAPVEPVLMNVRVRASGRRWWSLVSASPVFDDAGQVEFIIHVWHDVTARRRQQDSSRFLSEASALLARSLDEKTTLQSLARLAVPRLADWCGISMPDGEMIRSVAVAHVDPAKVELAREYQRRYPQRVDHPTGSAQVLRTGESRLIERITDEMLVAGIRNDPQRLELTRALGIQSFMLVPLTARGRVLGTLTLVWAESGHHFDSDDLALAEELGRRAGIAVDNARLYEESQRAVRTRDMLLATVSHDLKNPISSVMMGAQLLQKKLAAEDPLRTKVGAIQRAADRMEQLIRDLLDVARFESGTVSLERAAHPAAQLISDAIDLLQPLAQSKSIALAAQLAPAVQARAVHVDKRRILQVLENLISNAIKFAPAGAHIVASAAPDESSGPALRFTVEDDGPGIAPHEVPHIFERFWQAREIVQAHGGRIWVESAPGAGCRFHFTIPA